jgi:hypothetical protein
LCVGTKTELVTVGDQVFLGKEGLGLGLAALGVLGEDVDLDVEHGAGEQAVEAGRLVGVGDDGDLDDALAQRGDGETDALDGDRSLGDDVADEDLGEFKAQAPVGVGGAGGDGVERDEAGGAVDVALDDVAAEGRAGGRGWCGRASRRRDRRRSAAERRWARCRGR